jgi:hypothetical protein
MGKGTDCPGARPALHFACLPSLVLMRGLCPSLETVVCVLKPPQSYTCTQSIRR